QLRGRDRGRDGKYFAREGDGGRREHRLVRAGGDRRQLTHSDKVQKVRAATPRGVSGPHSQALGGLQPSGVFSEFTSASSSSSGNIQWSDATSAGTGTSFSSFSL